MVSRLEFYIIMSLLHRPDSHSYDIITIVLYNCIYIKLICTRTGFTLKTSISQAISQFKRQYLMHIYHINYMYVSFVAQRSLLYVEYLLFVVCGNIVSCKIVFDDCSDVTILYNFNGTRIKSSFFIFNEATLYFTPK